MYLSWITIAAAQSRRQWDRQITFDTPERSPAKTFWRESRFAEGPAHGVAGDDNRRQRRAAPQRSRSIASGPPHRFAVGVPYCAALAGGVGVNSALLAGRRVLVDGTGDVEMAEEDPEEIASDAHEDQDEEAVPVRARPAALGTRRLVGTHAARTGAQEAESQKSRGQAARQAQGQGQGGA